MRKSVPFLDFLMHGGALLRRLGRGVVRVRMPYNEGMLPIHPAAGQLPRRLCTAMCLLCYLPGSLPPSKH